MGDFPNVLYEPVFAVICVVPGCRWTAKALNPDLLLPEWERHRVLHNNGSDDVKCFSSEGICPTHGVTHLDGPKERAAEVRKYGVRELARRARADLYGNHTDGHADPS